MAAPLLALKQGHGPAAVGVLLALFSLTQIFLALPAGRYADRHGLKRPVHLSVAAAVSGAALAVAWPEFWALCASALLLGGATGAASLALQRFAGQTARDPTQLKQVFSWLAIGPAISNFLGPFCAGLLIDHAGHTAADIWGFRAAFLMSALLPLLTWWLTRTVPDSHRDATPDPGTPKRATDLLRNPQMRDLLIVNWFLSSCWDVHTFVLPVLGHERGFSASVIGTILGSFAVAAAAVRMVLPLVAAHLREWMVVSGAMLCTAALFGIYPLLQSPWSMGLCSVLLGLVLGSVQPMIMSTLHQITPPDRHGEALGLRQMTINGSSVVMPMLFGTVGTVVGVSVVFWTVGTLVGLGSRVAWRVRPRHHAANGTIVP